jgi:hypothetical protein
VLARRRDPLTANLQPQGNARLTLQAVRHPLFDLLGTCIPHLVVDETVDVE